MPGLSRPIQFLTQGTPVILAGPCALAGRHQMLQEIEGAQADHFHFEDMLHGIEDKARGVAAVGV